MQDELMDFVQVDNIQRLAQQQQLPRLDFTPAFVPPMQGPAPLGPLPAIPAKREPVFQTPYTSQTLKQEDLGLFANLIRKTESGHNYQAKNPHTSASGAYQYVNRTWGNYGGYPEARLAPRAVQDAKFNEDAIRKLQKFGGDPFKMIADHMLPSQANKPWLWSRPSTIMVRGKPVSIPPVAEYIQKVITGSPWESQFQSYLKAQGGV